MNWKTGPRYNGTWLYWLRRVYDDMCSAIFVYVHTATILTHLLHRDQQQWSLQCYSDQFDKRSSDKMYVTMYNKLHATYTQYMSVPWQVSIFGCTDVNSTTE